MFFSTLDWVKFWFYLLRSPSTWDFIYFDSIHSQDCLHDELLPKECAHRWFCPIWILLTYASVYLGVGPPGCLSTWKLYSLVSGQMTFCLHRMVSTIGSVNFGFCSLLVLSTFGSGHLGVCLLGFCTLGNLCTCYFVNWGLCQELVVFTLDSAPSWFCLLVTLSIQDSF